MARKGRVLAEIREVSGLTPQSGAAFEIIFSYLKVFSFKNSVKILQNAIAKCAQYHYYENVLSEMSQTDFGG
ncbi:hypothetical protein [Succinimonas sp.]|uniref:hypothetical protein n=1 Tax=Succinimonas sp. TaxID=1936151 RepID=UPI00386FF03E